MARGLTVNISQIIDSRRFGAFQWMVAIWCAVLVTLDGFDAGTINYVAPTLVREWHIAAPSMGPVFGAGLFGLMLGTLASGPISDHWGRKRTILVSTVIYCIFALLTTQAHSIRELFMLRFLNGIGVGGLMPTSIALTAEYAPKRIRATVIAIMFLGYPFGAGAGGFIGAVIIPHLGWQAMFLLAGVVPLCLLPIAAFGLPESVRFLVTRASRPDRVAELLNRLTGKSNFNGTEDFTIAEEKTLPGFTVKHLLNEGRALDTVLLWITFFCNLLVLFALASWLPLVMHESGVPLSWSLRLGGMMPWAGIVGTALLAPLVDRMGAPGIVTVLYLLASVFIFGIGLAGANVPLLMVTILSCGVCVVGGQGFINVLSAILYPTSVRSTGVGWALGIGRIGAVIGPVVAGLLLARHITAQHLFFMIAAPSLVAAFSMFLLGLRLRRAEVVSTVNPAVTAG